MIKECSLCSGAGLLECDEEGNMYQHPIKCGDCNGTGENKETGS